MYIYIYIYIYKHKNLKYVVYRNSCRKMFIYLFQNIREYIKNRKYKTM